MQIKNKKITLVNKDFRLSLKDGDIQHYLTSDEMNMLFEKNVVKAFKGGDIILKQGEKSKGIYLVLEGNIIITAKILGQGTADLEILGAGNFLGEISYLENETCTTSVIASSHVVCLFISASYLHLLSDFFPETKYKLFSAIIKQVMQRLIKMHDRITGIMSNTDMISKSFVSQIIHSFRQPSEKNHQDEDIDLQWFRKSNFLSKRDIKEILNHAKLIKVEKNTTLISKSEKHAYCYIVLRGAVLTSIVHDNKYAKLSVIGPQILFANMACIDADQSFKIDFSTCEQSLLLKITEKELIHIKENNPILWNKLFHLICKSIVMLEKSIYKLDIRLNIEKYNR